MAKVLLTAELGDRATVESAREQLGLEAGEIDDSFGLVPVDPDRGLYALMVEDAAAARLSGTTGVQGPFSNPVIEPFGPSGSAGQGKARADTNAATNRRKGKTDRRRPPR